MTRPTGLGRGLDALIPKTGKAREGSKIDTGLVDLGIGEITPNPNQPRVYFDEESLAELASSIRAVGVLQPILVRPGADGKFELIAGERRWRAAGIAGLAKIPAIVRNTEDVSSVEQALIENLHRQDLTPLEEAAAYKQLLDDFKLTHEKIAVQVGKTRSAITNSLRLLTLSPAIQQLLADGRLAGGHARAILGLTDRQAQEQLAKRCAEEGLTVRAVEKIVGEILGRGSSRTVNGIHSEELKRKFATLPDPGLLELQDLLAELLSTKVGISSQSGRGKVTIEFADYDDLERIYRKMTEGISR